LYGLIGPAPLGRRGFTLAAAGRRAVDLLLGVLGDRLGGLWLMLAVSDWRAAGTPCRHSSGLVAVDDEPGLDVDGLLESRRVGRPLA
jgi:hypothetical protein